jgi:rhodanese-related sulfurtransferase
MDQLKNNMKSLFYKPLESLVGCAEYIYILHSKSGHKKLFFGVVCATSLVMLLNITEPLNLKNAGKTSINLPKLFSSAPKVNLSGPYDPILLMSDIRTNNNNVLIVDVRSHEDFDQGHIKNAVHISVGIKDAQYPNKDDLSLAVKEIKKISEDKLVVVYGHFQGTSYVQELAQMLRKKNVSATSLAIGWNEWYHFRNLWLPESQWTTTDMNLYVQMNEE